MKVGEVTNLTMLELCSVVRDHTAFFTYACISESPVPSLFGKSHLDSYPLDQCFKLQVEIHDWVVK